MTAKKAVAKRPASKVANLPTVQSVHPGQMIQALMANPEVDIDKVSQLFELQEKYEANNARKAYHHAMSQFKGLVPQVKYDSWVNYANKGGGRTDFAFASLAGILGQIQETMEQCGLNATWKTASLEGGAVEVTCVVTHELGHSEATSLVAGKDESGGKNSIQAVKSTVSYLRRITLEAMLGLAAKADDDDGNGAGTQVQKVGANEVKQLTTLMAEAKANTAKFLKAFAIEKLDDLPLERMAMAVDALNKQKQAIAAKGGVK
ncbi:MAG: hypothetical protein E4H01_07480 [Lysobacterales bacterium]|nr:MAG: hypothetical protein E4H01_07480 [Xanthomonadales bacterium]